jgi:L-rhamnose 1-dehydrogenase
MSSLLAGKVVCITGASRGIGRACATEMVRHGATGLILHYFGDADTSEEIVTLREEVLLINADVKVVYVPGDIADPETSKRASAASLCGNDSNIYLRWLKKA